MSSAVALTTSATTANAQSTAETSQSRVARCIPRTIEVGRTGMEAMTRAYSAGRLRGRRCVARAPGAQRAGW